jgi:hypothetical protein
VLLKILIWEPAALLLVFKMENKVLCYVKNALWAKGRKMVPCTPVEASLSPAPRLFIVTGKSPQRKVACFPFPWQIIPEVCR